MKLTKSQEKTVSQFKFRLISNLEKSELYNHVISGEIAPSKKVELDECGFTVVKFLVGQFVVCQLTMTKRGKLHSNGYGHAQLCSVSDMNDFSEKLKAA